MQMQERGGETPIRAVQRVSPRLSPAPSLHPTFVPPSGARALLRSREPAGESAQHRVPEMSGRIPLRGEGEEGGWRVGSPRGGRKETWRPYGSFRPPLGFARPKAAPSPNSVPPRRPSVAPCPPSVSQRPPTVKAPPPSVNPRPSSENSRPPSVRPRPPTIVSRPPSLAPRPPSVALSPGLTRTCRGRSAIKIRNVN